jgi:hypothetical protein
MASGKRRGELTAAIVELQRVQTESNREATFGGWTREAEAAHERRAVRIADLCRELDALDEAAS